MTKDAASERSQTAASATSSGAPILPIGSLRIISISSFGVGGEVGLEYRGLDEARAHGVDPDSALGVFEGRILREPDDAVFAGHEGRRTGESDEAGDRCVVDDGAAALLEHLRDFVLHAKPNAGQVDAYYPVPEVQRVAGDIGAALFEDAGVVEGAIQLSESLDGAGDHCLDVRLPRHVRPDEARLSAL